MKILLFIILMTLTNLSFSQIYPSVTLTSPWDQLKFEVPGEPRYFLMSKPSTNSALALYSPENGGYYFKIKETTGDFLLSKGNLGIGTETPNAHLHVSGGTEGDVKFRLEADTDNNVESDNPLMEFRQDGGAVGMNVGFANNEFGNNIFGIGRRYLNVDYWDSFTVNTADGNVGIGTNAPSNRLVITGEEGNNRSLLIQNNSYNSTHNSGAVSFQFAFANHYGPKMEAFKITNNVTGLKLYTEYGYNISQLAMTFAPSGSGTNIGIGTDTPNAKVEIEVPHAVNQEEELRIGSYYQDEFIGLGLNYQINNVGTTSKHLVEHHRGTKYETMTFRLGNVGIGTDELTKYKLNVWGNVRAHEIVVNTDGADFVFEDDYELRPLKEVATYIKQYNHLPEIASATEMKENGVGVSELQTQLLQKIEELTLYLLKQEERLNAQQIEIDLLKEANNR